jgi:hypothetical protein
MSDYVLQHILQRILSRVPRRTECEAS